MTAASPTPEARTFAVQDLDLAGVGPLADKLLASVAHTPSQRGRVRQALACFVLDAGHGDPVDIETLRLKPLDTSSRTLSLYALWVAPSKYRNARSRILTAYTFNLYIGPNGGLTCYGGGRNGTRAVRGEAALLHCDWYAGKGASLNKRT